LGNCRDVSIMSLALNCWFSECYNTRILNAELSLYFLLVFTIIQLTVYKRTITRLVADDKVVYQRWEGQQLSMHARTLNYLSWRSQWIILCAGNRECQFHSIYHELIGAFLACLPHCVWGPPPSQCSHYYAPKAVCRYLVDGQECTRLAYSLQQTVNASKFQTIVASSCKIFVTLFNFYWYLALDIFPR